MKNLTEKNIVFFIAFAGMLVFFLAGSNSRVSAQTGTIASADTANVPTNQIIVQFKSSSQAFAAPAQADEMTRLSNAAGLALTYLRSMVGDANVIQLPNFIPYDQVQQITKLIESLPEVQYAEPDQRAFPVLSPNDTYFQSGAQWDLTEATGGINIQSAWDITTGSSSVVVADVDTGITGHADLVSRLVSGTAAGSGYDFVSNATIANDGNGRDTNPSDPGDWISQSDLSNPLFFGCTVGDSSWHGTHTAGTIGAASNNAMGIAGINWNSPLVIARVLGKCGGYFSDIIDGISWAAGIDLTGIGVPINTHPAKVINLSLGGTGSCSASMQTAVNNVNGQGAVLVVAAGNSNANVSGFTPANCNGVIAVAATDRTGSRAYYSNYGSLVKISAPGGSMSSSGDPNGILSTLNTGTQGPVSDTYVYYQGTSMATPHVTGVVSLMFSVNPSLTPAQVLSILQSTARNFPSGSNCTTTTCGAGIVNAAAAVSAAQALNSYTLTVNKSGTGSGTVSSTPPGINCGTSCSYAFPVNTSVTLSAISDSGSGFSGWSGAGCSGTGTCVVNMSSAQSVTATFNLSGNQTLTVNLSGSGVGSVSSNPTGIDCGATCSYGFPLNSSVILTANPTVPSTFGGWSGGGCSGTSTCTISMTSAISVTATFNPPPNQTLTVTKSGTGSGTIMSNPLGINCGATCNFAFPYNTNVILTAQATAPSTFDGWSGAGCSGTGICSVSMTSSQSVVATFNLPATQTLTVNKSGTGSGTVTSSPSGINCGATCSTNFPTNSSVILTARSSALSIFNGWSGGGCSGTGTCTVSMTSAQSVTATFKPGIVIYRQGAWLKYDFDTRDLVEGVWTGMPYGNCIPAPMDYNGDGVKDFTQLCNGTWFFYDDSGAMIHGIWVGDVAGQVPVPGNYTGSGKDDIVLFRNGAWLYYDYATGALTKGVWTGAPVFSGTPIPAPMDYTGDGKLDYTVYSGGPWFFFNADGSMNKGIWTGGVAGDMAVPGNYDGLGKDEIVIFRGGAWLFYDFTSGALTKGIWTGAPIFNGTPLPSPLDFTGDGLLDFTVFSGGPWFFFNSNGSMNSGIWTGGVSGDMPISNRYLP